MNRSLQISNKGKTMNKGKIQSPKWFIVNQLYAIEERETTESL